MKLSLDTSVLVRASLRKSEGHEAALEIANGPHQLFAAEHALIELYSALTGSRIGTQLKPRHVGELVREWTRNLSLITLERSDHEMVLSRAADLGLSGGAVYDLIHVRAAEKAGTDRLYTFNGRDFRRMPPAPPTQLVVL